MSFFNILTYKMGVDPLRMKMIPMSCLWGMYRKIWWYHANIGSSKNLGIFHGWIMYNPIWKKEQFTSWVSLSQKNYYKAWIKNPFLLGKHCTLVSPNKKRITSKHWGTPHSIRGCLWHRRILWFLIMIKFYFSNIMWTNILTSNHWKKHLALKLYIYLYI
jgi:hypothetical protein